MTKQPSLRPIRFALMLSKEERDQLDAAAKAAGLSRSDILRTAFRKQPPVQPSPKP
jgi:uncharacterized protein (DUF1778 family)